MPQIRLNRDALARACDICKRVVDAKADAPILACVRVEAVTGECVKLTGTDLDTEVECRLPDIAETDADLAVPLDALTRVVKAAKDVDSIGIQTGAGGVTIIADGLELDVETFPGNELPVVQEVAEPFGSVDIYAGTLTTALRKTQHAMSTEETRYYLRGIYFDAKKGHDIRLVATDGHRLAYYDVRDSSEHDAWGVIVPDHVVVLLTHLLKGAHSADSVSFVFTRTATGGERGRVSLGSFDVTFKCIDGSFPDYRALLAGMRAPTTVINAAPSTFLAAVDKIAKVGGKRAPIRLSTNDESVELTQRNPDLGTCRTSVSCEIEGPSIEFGVSAEYLRAAVSTIEGDEVRIDIQDANSPLRISDSGDPRLGYVLMPMRV